MSDPIILVTGDFWHSDFKSILAGFEVPVTLVPFEKAKTLADSSFDLVVIAQARRGQHCAEDVEALQASFSTTPIVALLGSWCEGETRSGVPWPGVPRVYWHQWEGQYQKFADQLSQYGISDWHAPRTSTIADRIARSRAIDHPADIKCVAISAWTNQTHAMVADAINHFGWSNCWVERAVWNAETSSAVDAIVIEADTWSDALVNRVQWIQRQIPDTPMVMVTNYPRRDELEVIKSTGISEVVSKPFELNELKTAVVRAFEASQKTQQLKPIAS